MSFSLWPALLAWGAGLIHIAVAAGAPPAVLFPFAALGVAELAWGVAALRLGRMPLVRTTLVLGVLAVLAGLGLALLDLMAWVPLLSTSIMLVSVTAAAAVKIRRRERTEPDASSRTTPAERPRNESSVSTSRALIGVVAGAALVSALTTPALAQTKAGDYAVPHGEMSSHHGH